MDDFDKQFGRMQKMAFVFGALWVVLVGSVLSGIAFVVFKLLKHFGIL